MSSDNVKNTMRDYRKLKKLVRDRFNKSVAVAQQRRNRDNEAIRIVRALYLELDMVNRAIKLLTGDRQG